MAPDKLLLWDIDGTLIRAGNAGERAIERAWNKVSGVPVDLKKIDYAGRTDRMIGRQLFEHTRMPLDENLLHEFVETYLGFLVEELLLESNGQRLPGVLEILELAAARADISQGLLTGNMVRGAEAKLTHYELWHFFEFGAYADDSHIRDELGPFALQRASQKYGYNFEPHRVFIIGDTPHDVQCARIIGARAIAVATGMYSSDVLAATQPDALFEDLSNPAAFLQEIERLASAKGVLQ